MKIYNSNLMRGQFFFFCLLLFTVKANSQNIATSKLLWQTNQANDLRSQNLIDYQCAFKTDGSQTIKWFQKNGQSVTTFTILRTQGTWTNINSPGSITYGLSRNTDRGKMIIEKNENGTFITLDFSETSTHAIKQRFRISSVQTTN